MACAEAGTCLGVAPVTALNGTTLNCTSKCLRYHDIRNANIFQQCDAPPAGVVSTCPRNGNPSSCCKGVDDSKIICADSFTTVPVATDFDNCDSDCPRQDANGSGDGDGATGDGDGDGATNCANAA